MRRVGLGEAMGLHPWRERVKQAKIALAGEQDVPATKWGPSSLRLLAPRLALPLWRGKAPFPRKVILSNLFNHTQTPVEAGWSVRRTQVQDFRGRASTYDSHNGTDLCIPVGTTVLTAAPGEVVQVISEFNRGGLKVFIDHGRGLMTCYAHLARALVHVGQVVARGAPIAISGYSGLDGFVTFPFGIPHVHFNTWLNGEPVDPFARAGEAPLWHGGFPTPPPDAPGAFTHAEYDTEAVDHLIRHCRTAGVREELAGLEPLSLRAARTIIASNYYPTRFPDRRNPYAELWAREERLDMPFSSGDFDTAVFADEL
jgi:murein DD-endopeptidase MepM/ murein hydrolase activator NlpD